MYYKILKVNRGTSEVAGALMLMLITTIFVSFIAERFINYSHSITTSITSQLEVEKARLMERLCIVETYSNLNELTLWILNLGRCESTIVEVLVNGDSFKLEKPLAIEPLEVRPLSLNISLEEGSSYTIWIKTSIGGIFRHEVKARP